MPKTTSLLFDLLVRPGRAFRQATAEKPILLGILIFALAVLSRAWAAAMAVGQHPETALAVDRFLVLAALAAGTGLALLAFWAGAVHLAADLLGGAGRGLGLLACLLLSFLPGALAGPIAALAGRLAGLAGWALLVAGCLPTGIWMVALQVAAVRQVYRFGWSKAAGALLLAALAAAVAAAGSLLASRLLLDLLA